MKSKFFKVYNFAEYGDIVSFCHSLEDVVGFGFYLSVGNGDKLVSVRLHSCALCPDDAIRESRYGVYYAMYNDSLHTGVYVPIEMYRPSELVVCELLREE